MPIPWYYYYRCVTLFFCLTHDRTNAVNGGQIKYFLKSDLKKNVWKVFMSNKPTVDNEESGVNPWAWA